MQKEENVIRFYVLCNKLKNIIRTGWKDWQVERDRLESVAEHIYGVQMLALAINSEYKYDIDMMKVIMMLSIHELEEIFIGDLTMFQISKEEKKKMGHQAISQLLNSLVDGNQIKELIYEFDERQTKEALFAHFCDKLECDLQSRLYGEENCVNLNNQEKNTTFNDPRVQKLLSEGLSWDEMWLKFGQSIYGYDENFTALSNYALTHKISDFGKEEFKYKK